MHTFKDAIGEEWAVTLDTAKVRQLREQIGVDLFRIDDANTLEALINDDEKLVDVISVICTSQIEHRKLDASLFAQRMLGDALDNACDALIDELVFISRRNRREVIAAAWNKTKTFQEIAKTKAMEAIESTELETAIVDHITESIRGGTTSPNVRQS